MTEKTEGIKIEDAAEAKAAQEAEEAAAEETSAEEQAQEAADQAEETAEDSGNSDGAEADKAEESEASAGETAPQDTPKEEAAGEDDSRYLRLLAEFQNYKKRTEKEKTDLYSYANEKIMTELIEVLDNFERALDQEPGEGFKEGMELIFTQLSTCLTKAGLAEITALGEDFDPNVHNAVMAEETEEYESGKVSGVMQKGYTLNGKVIRPSMVKVAN